MLEICTWGSQPNTIMRDDLLPWVFNEAKDAIDESFARSLFNWRTPNQIHSVKERFGPAPRWGVRICTCCGSPMNQGWMGDGGVWYACSPRCLLDGCFSVVQDNPEHFEAKQRMTDERHSSSIKFIESIQDTFKQLSEGTICWVEWEISSQMNAYFVDPPKTCWTPNCERKPTKLVCEGAYGENSASLLRCLCGYCSNTYVESAKRQWGESLDDEYIALDEDRIRALSGFKPEYLDVVHWLHGVSIMSDLLPTKVVRVFDSKDEYDLAFKQFCIDEGFWSAKLIPADRQEALEYDEKPRWSPGVYQ